MKITYYGHATIGIETKGTHLLIDPFITPNELAKHIDVDQIPADYVLLTHGHYDHVADAEAILKRTGAMLISNFEIVSWYGQKGFSRSHPMNHGGSHQFHFGRVQYVAAVHSSVLPDGTYGGNAGGFVIQTPDKTVYISGDTALTWDMKILADKYEIDAAVLCMGDNFTMGPEDAATAASWVGTKNVIGVHYDTFPPIHLNKEEARRHFATKAVTLHLPAIGESVSV